MMLHILQFLLLESLFLLYLCGDIGALFSILRCVFMMHDAFAIKLPIQFL